MLLATQAWIKPQPIQRNSVGLSDVIDSVRIYRPRWWSKHASYSWAGEAAYLHILHIAYCICLILRGKIYVTQITSDRRDIDPHKCTDRYSLSRQVEILRGWFGHSSVCVLYYCAVFHVCPINSHFLHGMYPKSKGYRWSCARHLYGTFLYMSADLGSWKFLHSGYKGSAEDPRGDARWRQINFSHRPAS